MNPNDYLLQSAVVQTGLISVKDLQSETIDKWHLILEDKETSDEFKILIKFFFIPFNISMIKVNFNLEYSEEVGSFGSSEHSSFWKNYDHIAPSLRQVYKDRFDIPLGYPKKFIACFPDVVNWAMKGEGLSLIKSTFYKRDPDQYITNRSLNLEVLIEIVLLYLKVSKKELECSMITK